MKLAMQAGRLLVLGGGIPLVAASAITACAAQKRVVFFY
jgi:hypothetical protein